MYPGNTSSVAFNLQDQGERYMALDDLCCYCQGCLLPLPDCENRLFIL